MMLRFLEDPVKYGQRWLRYGGLQTLASFGIGTVTEGGDDGALKGAAVQLAQALGSDLLHWLRHLPNHWQSGNVAVVHAGADPALPIIDQKTRHLHWGHKNFETTRRTDDLWVLHGHTIIGTPVVENGRISIDTGAYATGRLTAAHVYQSGIDFGTA